MAIISYKDLSNIRKNNPHKKIVFCSGSFDLTHVGHVRFLEVCKNLGDMLIVAVGKDIDISKKKGDVRPILNEHIRIKMVDSLKPVDYAFHNNSPRILENRLSSLEEIFEHLMPNIWVINYDSDEIENRKILAKKFNINLVILQLDRNKPTEYEGISTTLIIKKISDLK